MKLVISKADIDRAHFPEFVSEHLETILRHERKLAGWIAALFRDERASNLRATLYRARSIKRGGGYFHSPGQSFQAELHRRWRKAKNGRSKNRDFVFYGPQPPAKTPMREAAQNAAVINLITWAAFIRYWNFGESKNSLQKRVQRFEAVEKRIKQAADDFRNLSIEVDNAAVRKALRKTAGLRVTWATFLELNHVAFPKRERRQTAKVRFFVFYLSNIAAGIFDKRLDHQVAVIANILFERNDITPGYVRDIFRSRAGISGVKNI